MEHFSNKALQDFAGRTRYVCDAICSERRAPLGCGGEIANLRLRPETACDM
jgi:hypothetical protein